MFQFFFQEIPENEAVENVQVSSSPKWIWKEKTVTFGMTRRCAHCRAYGERQQLCFICTNQQLCTPKYSRFVSALAKFSASVGTPPPFKDQGADAAPKAVGGE